MDFLISNLSHLQLEVVVVVVFLCPFITRCIDLIVIMSPAMVSWWDPGHSRQCQAYEETPRDSGKTSPGVE